MSSEPIIITADDLGSKKVEKRLAEHAALARNREQTALASEKDAVQIQVESVSKPSLWYNAAFTLTVFGFLGGLLAWGTSELVLKIRPTDRTDAVQYIKAANQINEAYAANRVPASLAEPALRQLQLASGRNPYLAVHLNNNLSADEKQRQLATLESRDRRKEAIASALAYGLSGMLIAFCLAVAEPVIDRNSPRAVIDGSMGAALGLIGGVSVSLFVEQFYLFLSHHLGSSYQIIARVTSWGLLGIFLSIAPGLAMRNYRRTMIGVAGGAIGGLIGGIMFDAIGLWTDSPVIGRLIAMISIGAIAGLGTGLIEAASKAGWVKVTAGLIAGKQFVIYRNPTYIGSGPECQIYLFKDPKVGRRHAAMHIVPGGFEIEDLPVGEQTQVNGNVISRQRLHHGDKIRIGASMLVFQEKSR